VTQTSNHHAEAPQLTCVQVIFLPNLKPGRHLSSHHCVLHVWGFGATNRHILLSLGRFFLTDAERIPEIK